MDQLELKDPEKHQPGSQNKQKQLDRQDTNLDRQLQMDDRQLALEDKAIDRLQKQKDRDDENKTVLCALTLDMVADQIEAVSSDLSYELDMLTNELEGKKSSINRKLPVIIIKDTEPTINYDML
jgi:hypothetical protein